MKKLITLVLFVATFFSFAQQKLNSERSIANFKIKNMFGNVEGTFRGFSGTVNFDPNNLSSSSFDVSINPASVNTESEKRDEHLKNEDFFDVASYTTISFVSESIVKKGDTYQATGKLTMRGATNTEIIYFKVDEKSGEMVLKGTLEVNRFDYNLDYGNTFMVGETATIDIMAVVEK